MGYLEQSECAFLSLLRRLPPDQRYIVEAILLTGLPPRPGDPHWFLFGVSPAGSLTWASPAIEDILGIPMERLVGQQAPFLRSIDNMSRSTHDNCQITKTTGDTIKLEVYTQPIVDAAQNLRGASGVVILHH